MGLPRPSHLTPTRGLSSSSTLASKGNSIVRAVSSTSATHLFRPRDRIPPPLITEAASWPKQAEGTRPSFDDRQLLQGVLKAQTRVYDVCKETDLQFAPRLSALLNNKVYIKREDQQPVFSFKLRGAYNKLASLPSDQLSKGIVTCSAGNHAQGVSLSSTKLQVDNLIVMPKGTPLIKVDAVRRFGGNVLLHGENFDLAQAEAVRLAQQDGRTMIHPFDDFEVICGQATIGVEISKQLPRNEELHAVFCCVGGGGLLAGVSSYLKRVSPESKMIGVEAADSACMTRSLEKGEITTLDAVGLFADGAAVRTPGKLTYELIRQNTDAMVTVTTDEICAAIKAGFNDTRTVFEPAGALAIAGLVRYVRSKNISGKTLVAVASGANMDFDRLRFVSERADGSEELVSARIPERPGSFWELYQQIYPRNITEFSYRASHNVDAEGRRYANVMVGLQPKTKEDMEDILQAVRALPGFAMDAMTDDELSKTHIRHMACGRATGLKNERVFRFEFPERPGALKLFLQGLFADRSRPFDITLFHYRAHGADVGRVFTGFQIDDSQTQAFEQYLSNLISNGSGFSAYEETSNAFYREFLL